MTEIIYLNVGQCGNEVGQLFWDDVCLEHGIDKIGTFHGSDPDNQLAKINVCFNEEFTGKYQPRCIFTDFGTGKMDSLRSGRHATLFRNDNIISEGTSSGNCWPNGHYIYGPEIRDIIMDAYRRESEKCDCLQGVIFTHSLGGGTGSGMGSMLMQEMKDENAIPLTASVSIFPSIKESNCTVEPYNATLSIPDLWQNCDAVFCIDNEALNRICGEGSSEHPVYSDMNKLVSSTMSGVTSTLRFPSHINENLLKLCMNMVPFPANHFFIQGLAPINRHNERQRHSTVSDIIRDVFDVRNTLASCDPSKGRYLSAMVMFRGWATKNLIDESMIRCQSKNHEVYVEWVPDNLKTSVSNIGETQKISATTIGNNSAISEVFRKLSENVTALFRRKAFMMRYNNYFQGIDETEMQEAIGMLNDLISIYSTYDSYEGDSMSSDSEGETESSDVEECKTEPHSLGDNS